MNDWRVVKESEWQELQNELEKAKELLHKAFQKSSDELYYEIKEFLNYER